jgi:hypothetical protein
VRRLAALGFLATLVLAGCGGSAATDQGSPPQPAPVQAAVPEQVVVNQPTPESLAVRKRLLAEIAAGTYGDCGCTGEARAKDRIRSGTVKPPDPDQLVSALP